jgi:hypothetical protein
MKDVLHVSEEDLTLAVMDELPPGRGATVAAHLEVCSACRSSAEELRKLFENFADSRRASLDAQMPSPSPARAALSRRLAEERATVLGRFAASGLGVQSAIRWAAVAALVGIAAVAWRSRPAYGVDERFVPDPRLTPGFTIGVSQTQLCSSAGVGPPTLVPAVAREIFRLHGIDDPRPGAYELDYLIPPELGGSSDARNLWPQPYDADPWNAHAKDALEDRLLALVCEGEVELATAQRDLAQDWTAAYRRYFQAEQPLVEHASFLKDQPWR